MDDTLNDHTILMGKPHQDMGAMLEPLFTWRGADVYPLFGAEGEEEGEGGADGEPGTDEDDSAGKGSEGDGEDAVSRADFDKLRGQLSAADKARAAAEKKLKEIDDGKKDELTKATERAEELEKANAAQAKELAEMRLQNAFLTADTGVQWHDPADALALAERQGYLEGVIGEDGKVDSAKLTVKLKELAKAKKHLVKTSGDDGSGSEEPKPPTGTKVGSGGKPNNKSDDKIPSRYAKHFR